MANRMSVKNAKKADRGPFRELVYGVEGVGKSSFAAGAPSPVFLGAEEGTRHLGVEVFSKPESWADVLAAIDSLGTEDHPFKTLVADTVDWIEPLAFAEVCRVARKRSIEDLGFGKGYTKAIELCWRPFLKKLGDLQAARKMNVILLAHAQVKKTTTPTGEAFDRYTLKLHDRAGALLKEWAESVLFANYALEVREDERTKRTFGASSGARLLHTTWTAAFDAKNRYGLPDTLALSFPEFEQAVERGTKDRSGAIAREFERGVAMLRDREKASVAQKAFAEARARGDEQRMRDVANRLRVRLEEQEAENLEVSDEEQAAAVEQEGASPSTNVRVETPAAAPLSPSISPEPVAAGHVEAPQSSPERKPAPVAAAPLGGSQATPPGEERRAAAGATAATPPPAQVPARTVRLEGRVTARELAAYLGKAGENQVRLLEELEQLLANPRTSDATQTATYARLLVCGGWKFPQVEEMWRGVGGGIPLDRKGKKDFAPIPGVSFSDFVHTYLREVIVAADSDMGRALTACLTPAEVLGSAPAGF